MNWSQVRKQVSLGLSLGLLAGWGLWAAFLRRPQTDVLLNLRAGAAATTLERLSLQIPPERLLEQVHGLLRPLFTAPAVSNRAETVTGNFSATVARRARQGREIFCSGIPDTRVVWFAPPPEPPTWRVQRRMPGGDWRTIAQFPPGFAADDAARQLAERLRGEMLAEYEELKAFEPAP